MSEYLAVLGRLQEISVAELEALYGGVQRVSDGLAVFETDREVDIARLGGTMKVGEVLAGDPVEYLRGLPEGKITLGVSDYRKKRERQLGLMLKRKAGRSMRVVPSEDGVVSGATALHNGLGRRANRVELAYYDGGVASVVAQDVDAYAARDQVRPARDAKVGMLPPKLAQILINLCGWLPAGARVLDPFCGTGVVLQEALLMGYEAYGTDRSEKMVEYSRRNLEWLMGEKPHRRGGASSPLPFEVSVGDATSFAWSGAVDAVASEVYLGSPLSQPPSEVRLRELKAETGEILVGFLRNLAGQVRSGVPVVLAVPAWRRGDGSYSGLNILDSVEGMGYNVVKFNTRGRLLYFREGQVVAREIIVLRKK